jgi:signal transduction histidine kinase
MPLLKLSRRIAIFLGLGWSLIYSTTLSNTVQLQRLELGIRDILIQQRGSRVEMPKDLLLVIIDQNTLNTLSLQPEQSTTPKTSPEVIVKSGSRPVVSSSEPKTSGGIIDPITGFELRSRAETYANLVERLMELGAKGVLMNLPNALTANLDHSELQDRSIQNLVEKYSNRLVLTSYPYSGRAEVPTLPIYNKFLPTFSPAFEKVSNQGDTFTCKENTTLAIRSSIAPPEIQGFFEFDPILGRVDNSESWINRIYTARRDFQRSDCIDGNTQAFDSAAFLAYKKFLGHSDPSWVRSTVQLNFWGKEGQRFPRLSLQDICSARTRCTLINQAAVATLNQQVQNKIVLIGLLGSEPNSFPLLSPFGDRPAVEMQANLLASMITNSFYYPLDRWYGLGIISVGATLISWGLSFGINKSPDWYFKLGLLMILGAILGYCGLVLLAFEFQTFLPVMLPVVTWVSTSVSVTACLMLWQRQERFDQQRQALVEREAVLAQTRKLLSRVATDIHDGPLQELKLVMDRLEELETLVDPKLLRLHQRDPDSEFVLDTLIRVGRGIRDQLNNMHTIAQKQHNVSPELSAGLVVGIQERLQSLVATGELRLKVIPELQPLKEPRFDKTWIDAREDIFRFFKEAIHNVIHHAQSPYGNATYVRIVLKQSTDHCLLMIQNDGANGSDLAIPSSQRGKGQGTKLMATLAAELPDGAWSREFLANGVVYVTLKWTLPGNPSK